MSSATLLADGTLGWLASNLDRFDPFSASAQRGRGRTVKAVLELALLCHCARPGWTRSPAPSAMRPRSCARPGATRTSLASSPAARPPWPASTRSSPPRWHRPAVVSPQLRAAIAALARGGHLSPCGKSPYGRLETRFYADTAGLAHAIEPTRGSSSGASSSASRRPSRRPPGRPTRSPTRAFTSPTSGAATPAARPPCSLPRETSSGGCSRTPYGKTCGTWPPSCCSPGPAWALTRQARTRARPRWRA